MRQWHACGDVSQRGQVGPRASTARRQALGIRLHPVAHLQKLPLVAPEPIVDSDSGLSLSSNDSNQPRTHRQQWAPAHQWLWAVQCAVCRVSAVDKGIVISLITNHSLRKFIINHINRENFLSIIYFPAAHGQS